MVIDNTAKMYFNGQECGKAMLNGQIAWKNIEMYPDEPDDPTPSVNYRDIDYIKLSNNANFDFNTKAFFNANGANGIEIKFRATNGELLHCDNNELSVNIGNDVTYYFDNQQKTSTYAFLQSGQTKNITNKILTLKINSKWAEYYDENGSLVKVQYSLNSNNITDSWHYTLTSFTTTNNVNIKNFNGDIFYCKFYNNNGTLIHNYQPKLEENSNIVAFYDTIDDQYYSITSGTATAGEDYIPATLPNINDFSTSGFKGVLIYTGSAYFNNQGMNDNELRYMVRSLGRNMDYVLLANINVSNWDTSNVDSLYLNFAYHAAEVILSENSSARIWFSFPNEHGYSFDYSSVNNSIFNKVRNHYSSSIWNNNIRGFYWATEERDSLSTMSSIAATVHNANKSMLWIPYCTNGPANWANDLSSDVNYFSSNDIVILQTGIVFNSTYADWRGAIVKNCSISQQIQDRYGNVVKSNVNPTLGYELEYDTYSDRWNGNYNQFYSLFSSVPKNVASVAYIGARSGNLYGPSSYDYYDNVNVIKDFYEN